MFWFRKATPVDDVTTPGRPEGTFGTTGLLFSGWYGVASQSLLHASRDDDPRCQKVLCIEARIGCKWARAAVKNDRQLAMCDSMDDAIDALYKLAQDAPPLPVPHDHPL